MLITTFWDWIKIFLSLDPKAESKIAWLDFLWVAVAFLFYLLL